MLTNNSYKKLTDSISWNNIHFVESRGVWLHKLLQARFIEMINEPETIISAKESLVKVLDIGCFPGSFGIILKKYFKDKIQLDGTGLGLTADYRNDTNIKATYENLYEVEFDPDNLQNKNTSIPINLPTDRACYYDIVIAGEVFEHLYSPLHFLSECHNLIVPTGILLITTPNISYFGNICRLFVGKSVHETLETSHIFLKNDWRHHIRVYDKFEINKLLANSGFIALKVKFIDNKEDLKERLSFLVKLKMLFIRIFFIVPHLRNQYIGIFRKDEK